MAKKYFSLFIILLRSHLLLLSLLWGSLDGILIGLMQILFCLVSSGKSFIFLPPYRGALVSCKNNSNKFSMMHDLASASIISLSLMSPCPRTQIRVMAECLAIFSRSNVFLDFEDTFSRDLMVALLSVNLHSRRIC